MSEASKRKEKQNWATEKRRLDNAGRLRGIYFIDPKDEEFKDVIRSGDLKELLIDITRSTLLKKE